MRIIKIDFTHPSACASYSSVIIGNRGEKNATSLIAILPAEMVDEELSLYRFVCLTDENEVVRSAWFNASNLGTDGGKSTLEWSIPAELTFYRIVSVQVEAWSSDNSIIIKTPSFNQAIFGESVIPDVPSIRDGDPTSDSINYRDNFTPVVELDDVSDGVSITVTDKFGTTTKTISNGKSAYQIAVENGFVGSEQSWIDSLHNLPIVDASDAGAFLRVSSGGVWGVESFEIAEDGEY